MLGFVLSLSLLAAGPSVQLGQPPPPTFAEAEQLANEGRNADALAAFQRIASVNPNDHEARLWIARLHERMRHPDLAEAVYRSVLLEDPSNIEAMIGVGVTLLAQHETEDAIDMLERAEELQPQREVVLVALGEAHQEAGDPERAIVYMERALAAAPSEQRLLRLEAARRSYLHSFEVRGAGEDYNTATAATRNVAVALNARVNDRWRLIGRGDVQRKFGFTDQRGGGGVEWRWRPATALFGHALIGPDNEVMPEGDFLGGLNHTYESATWTLWYRYFNFTGANVAVFGPGVEWQSSPRLALSLGYAASLTESNLSVGDTAGHSGYVRGAYQLYPRLAILAGWAGGVSDWELFSIDEIGRFEAYAGSAGIRWDLPTLTSIIVNYEYQWRPDDVRRQRLTVAFGQPFRSFKP
jgi:tetratricopeptide (TPR) repeat protein